MPVAEVDRYVIKRENNFNARRSLRKRKILHRVLLCFKIFPLCLIFSMKNAVVCRFIAKFVHFNSAKTSYKIGKINIKT